MISIALRAFVIPAVLILAFVTLHIGDHEMKNRPPIPFCVDRHTSVKKFSDTIARSVIQKGVDILWSDDPPKGEDVPTDVPLVLSGSVGTFSEGDGTVMTAGDLDSLFQIQGDVHVVRGIQCCGGEKNGILGCSASGKPIIVMEGIPLEAAAVLWMHELGHNKGLCHRDRSYALMAPDIVESDTNVNQYEHDVFEGATPNPCDQEEKSKPKAVDVIQFVHKVFIEGVPYKEGSGYTAAAVPPLLELLDKPDEQRSWLNIITVLGMIGDRQAWMPIKKTFERDSGELSPQNYAAKLAVPLALGYLLSKGHDQQDEKILDYLNTGLRPSEWSKRVSWRKSKDQSDEARNVHLTTLTILGLGISGRPEALTTLQALYDQLLAMQATKADASLKKRSETATSNRALQLRGVEPEALSILKAAIKTNQLVQKDGLVKYYHDSELEQLGFNL
ncbi:MAG TPA: hypothetical protein VNZ47_03515 [Candidatus Dormibacteraeota bacterium]|jgi:hypothetical protein|nr:hypothetical protein [Candidatus Dormibacteraeota bacterium]